MLGRHHLLLSLFTAILIILPYFEENTELTLILLMGIAIGSLIPDADSPDAAIFHEKIKGVKGDLGKLINHFFAPIFPLFGYVTKYAIYRPSIFIFGRTFLKKYNVKERHRGFLHSFIGIGTSALLTSIYLIIILYLLDALNWIFFLGFVCAYIVGALLHLLEDSATVTGTQFNYPFSKIVLKGQLVTRPDSTIKPDLFTGFMGILVVGLFFAIDLDYLPYADWLITLMSIFVLIVVWLTFLIGLAKVRFEKGELKSYSNVKSFF